MQRVFLSFRLWPLVPFVFFSSISTSSILTRDRSLATLNISIKSCLFLRSSRVHNPKDLNMSSYDSLFILLIISVNHNIGHSKTKSGNRQPWHDRSISWLPASRSRLGSSISCDPEFYGWRRVGYGKCAGVLHFGGIWRLACRAISAFAEHTDRYFFTRSHPQFSLSALTPPTYDVRLTSANLALDYKRGSAGNASPHPSISARLSLRIRGETEQNDSTLIDRPRRISSHRTAAVR